MSKQLAELYGRNGWLLFLGADTQSVSLAYVPSALLGPLSKMDGARVREAECTEQMGLYSAIIWDMGLVDCKCLFSIFSTLGWSWLEFLLSYAIYCGACVWARTPALVLSI